MSQHHVKKSCLYSTVKNTAGNAMIFGYLPPHGVQLAAGEEYTMVGDIRSYPYSPREWRAFGAAIDAGFISIIQTPAPIILDSVTGLSKQLHIASGTITAVTPCFDVSDSLDVSIPAEPDGLL